VGVMNRPARRLDLIDAVAARNFAENARWWQ
jgi:hypothetical protein